MSDKTLELIELKNYLPLLNSLNLKQNINNKTIVVLIKNTNFKDFSKELIQFLSAQEKERFSRISIQDLQQKFIIHRALLRLQLANILKLPASEITIDISKYGKPFLNQNINGLGLKFNLSHSENYALYAFSLNSEVGIDIEEARPHMALFETASLVLAKCEIAQLKALPSAERSSAFLKLWTKKEAISKALGQGLNMDFKTLVVGLGAESLAPASYPHIVLNELSLAPHYFACLANY